MQKKNKPPSSDNNHTKEKIKMTDQKINELLNTFTKREIDALADFISLRQSKVKDWSDLDAFDRVAYLFEIIKASDGHDWTHAQAESQTLDKIYNARIELKALCKAFQYLD